MSKGEGFVRGFTEAERQFYEDAPSPDGEAGFANPYQEGTEEYEGFEEGVYTFTQK